MPDAANAIALAAELERPVPLPLTDAVLPGRNGREATREKDRRRARLLVLHVSGYVDDLLLLRNRVAELGLPFLAVPFTVSVLATAVLTAEMEKNFTLESWETDKGFVLTCQARPLTERVVVSYDDR